MYPLSAGGLCDAVTITPAAHPRSVIDHASTGVGSGRSSTSARMPAPAITRAVSRANTSLLWRASNPITTPLVAAAGSNPMR